MNLKQKLLIEYLISSSDTYALCASILDDTYFDPELKPSVKFIKTYYDQYNTMLWDDLSTKKDHVPNDVPGNAFGLICYNDIVRRQTKR